MNRIVAHVVVGVLLLAAPTATFAGETGMSHDDTVNPGAPTPHIAPPGGSNAPRPLSTNTTPRTEATPLPSGLPPREVQPGEETPQAEDQTRGQIKRPLPGTAGQSGGDGTQTEDELFVGRKAGGGQVSSGDDDDMDDQEVERHTVQGVETPGTPAKGGSKPLTRSGGDGTQTEDELYLGRKATGTPLESAAQTPKAAAPGTKPQLQKPGSNLTTRSLAAPAVKGPGAIVIPRGNCGTHWTNWENDPDGNPCPANCERGERLTVNQSKNGNVTQYRANYRCYLPELVVNQPPGALREPGAPPRRNCGTFWTTKQIDPNADVNPCPANCERGELRLVSRSTSGDKSYYEMNYQCYMAKPGAKPGASAAGAATARGDLRKKAGADATMKSTASTAGTTQPGEPRPKVSIIPSPGER